MAIPSAEFRALLEEAKSEPDDDTPRQVLADWLQDQDDPRGEFLFVQIRRSRLPADDPEQEALALRERQLLSAHALTWLGPLTDLAGSWTFHRGMIALVARADRLITKTANDLAHQGAFDWVEELALRGVSLDHLGRLGDSPILDRLVCLDLSFNNLRDAGIDRLGRSNRLIALRELRLAGNRITSEGIRPLAASPQMEGLFRLDLAQNRIDFRGALALARSKHLDELTHLDLRGNRVNEEALTAVLSRFGAGVRHGPYSEV